MHSCHHSLCLPNMADHVNIGRVTCPGTINYSYLLRKPVIITSFKKRKPLF